MNTLQFRPDINALRAIAVLLVMLYHFGVGGFSGGFVGVDIFFVISGFLMTQILVQGLRTQEDGGAAFSVFDFYLSRGRRIAPALLALCATLLVLGWFFLIPQDYARLAEHAGWSSLFVSNIHYLREFGYFDQAAHEKWLMHTWSLALEWQFYLLFPWLLKLLRGKKVDQESLFWKLLIAAMASFAFSVWASTAKPAFAFYMLPSRAWEMLAGALLAMLPSVLPLKRETLCDERLRLSMQVVGLVAIGGGMFLSGHFSSWSPIAALVPVFGAALLMVSGSHESSAWWTELPFMQWVGVRSYSVYLWHWPVVVAMHQSGLLGDSLCAAILMMATMFVAHWSYAFIETPSRKWLRDAGRAKARTALWLATISIFTGCALLYASGGAPSRMDSVVRNTAAEEQNVNAHGRECRRTQPRPGQPCHYGGPKIAAIVVGDSHAEAVSTAVLAAAPGPDAGVVDFVGAGCPFLAGEGISASKSFGRECAVFVANTLEALKSSYPGVPVLIVGRWAQHAHGKNEEPNDKIQPRRTSGKAYASDAEFLADFSDRVAGTACDLKKSRPVYMLKPIPELVFNVPAKMAQAAMWGRSADVSISLADYMQRQEPALRGIAKAELSCGVQSLDPLPYFCAEGVCHGGWEGRAAYYDDDHLSEWGNRRLVPEFKRMFH